MSSSAGGVKANAKKEYAPKSLIERKVIEAIAMAKERQRTGEEKVMPLVRIFLKFPQFQEVFGSIRTVFDEFDRDNSGEMDHKELRAALSRLTCQDVTQEEAADVFHEADIFRDGKISLREFIVCLAIGYLLRTMPALRDSTVEGKAPENKQLTRLKDTRGRPSFLMGEGPKLAKVFHMMMDAYLQFDQDGTGFISRDDMAATVAGLASRSPSKRNLKTVSHESHAKGTNAVCEFLTEERMAEMDWNAEGQCSFSEFVFTFLHWCGFDEDEDEDEEEAGSKK